MWLSLALVSALLLGIRRVYEKELSARFGNFSLALVLQVFSIPFVFAMLFFFPVPANIFHLSLSFWTPLLIIWIGIIPIQTYFLYRSLREGELSEVTPVAALLPVFNVVTSYVVIGELPGVYGLIGVVLTVYATFLLLSDIGSARMTYNRPVLFMVISIACTAVGSTLDKVAIGVSTPVFYSFINICGSAIVFFLFMYVYREREKDLKQIREFFWTLCMLGAVLALAFVTFTAAFAIAPTSYVLALRSGGFLAASLWGIVFLHESLSSRKIAALVLFALGTLALAIN